MQLGLIKSEVTDKQKLRAAVVSFNKLANNSPLDEFLEKARDSAMQASAPSRTF